MPHPFIKAIHWHPENMAAPGVLRLLVNGTAAELLDAYLTAAERGGEAGTAVSRDHYRRELAAIDAVAAYRFPGEWQAIKTEATI